MNSAEHKAKAETILSDVARGHHGPVFSDTRSNAIATAQVHATLATIPDETPKVGYV